jgi:methylene-tetrahydromethanopterin dehydrogenase
MADKHILHMLSPLKHVSPFDVNMALDAGYDAVVPYGGVVAAEVTGLVQDAIFSRPPQLGVRTAVFIGGRDALAALDMMEAARQAMVPPFVVSVFADPAGSFTTAAAMVARTEKLLRERHKRTLSGLRVAVFGATGVVGFAAGVIAGLQGAVVTLVGHDGLDRVGQAAAEISHRFGVSVQAADGSEENRKGAILSGSDVVFCAAKAGVQVVGTALLHAAGQLLVVADVNAVPPSGVEGLDAMADGVRIGNTPVLGIGALAIGQTKYGTEFGLFRRMIEAEQPVAFDFRDAFALARELAA